MAGAYKTCITGMVLSIILAYFRYNNSCLHTIAKHFRTRWAMVAGTAGVRSAPRTHRCARRSACWRGCAFSNCISKSGVDALRVAQRRGREFLLVHRLFRSRRTGSIIKSDFTRFVFPPRWHYDILRALDYFQAVDAKKKKIFFFFFFLKKLKSAKTVAGR